MKNWIATKFFKHFALTREFKLPALRLQFLNDEYFREFYLNLTLFVKGESALEGPQCI